MKNKIFLSLVVATALNAEVFDLGIVEVDANKDSSLTSPLLTKVDKASMELNNNKNVAEVANQVSGLNHVVSTGQRNETTISIRGFNSARVPVYIDGIPIYMPYDGYMDLGRFTTVDLAQIDISKGASSVLYGPNSLGGVINLISSKPKKELEAELHVGGKFGDTNGAYAKRFFDRQADFRLGTKQEKFYFQLSGSKTQKYHGPDSGSYSIPSNVPDQSYSNHKKDKKIAVKLGFTPSDNQEYALTYINQKAEKTGRIYAGKNPKDHGANMFWYWPKWDKESFYFLSNTSFDSWYIKSRVYYDKFKNELQNMSDEKFDKLASGQKGWISKYDDHSVGGGLEFGFETCENNTLKIAPNYKEDVHKQKKGTNELWTKDKDKIYSFALEDTYDFSPATSMVIGASYDYRKTVEAQKYDKKTTKINDLAKRNDNSFNYQIMLAHTHTGDDRVYASFAKKSYFPTLKEKYSEGKKRHKKEPNPDLEHENSYNFEIGYDNKLENLDYHSAVFYSRIDDKIMEVKYNSAKNQNQNVGKVDVAGVEFGINAKLNDILKVGGNYTYLYSDVKDKDTDGRKMYLSDIPTHKFFAYGELKINPKARLYVSEYAQTSSKSDENGDYKAAGFAVTNAKVIYDATKNLSMDFGVENLFDKNYAYNEGYFEDGRAFVFNFNYKY